MLTYRIQLILFHSIKEVAQFAPKSRFLHRGKSQTTKLCLIIERSAAGDLWEGSISLFLEEAVVDGMQLCPLCFMKILSV